MLHANEIGKGVIKMKKHVLSVLVENHSGVLSRVAGLFSRRGYNIDSLSVGETEDSKISRMTIVTAAQRILKGLVFQTGNKFLHKGNSHQHQHCTVFVIAFFCLFR